MNRYLIRNFMDADSGEVSSVYVVVAEEPMLECDCEAFVAVRECVHRAVVLAGAHVGGLPVEMIHPDYLPELTGKSLEENLAIISEAVLKHGVVDLI